jgi:CspA family cold shock protein
LKSEKSFREPRGRGFNGRSFAPGRADRFGAPSRRPRAPSGPPIRATLKWFSPEKGFGFVTLEDGSGDAFLHASAVEQSGQDAGALQPGAILRVRIEQGTKGTQVGEILEIEASTLTPSPESKPPRRPADRPVDRKPTRMIGTVKWYSPVKRFGFIAVDSGREDVFVHAGILQQSGVPNLSEGQRVEMQVAEGRKGLEAVSISLR